MGHVKGYFPTSVVSTTAHTPCLLGQVSAGQVRLKDHVLLQQQQHKQQHILQPSPPSTAREPASERLLLEAVRGLGGSSRRSVNCDSSFVCRHNSSTKLLSCYEEVQELGVGSYGRVTLVRERETGQLRVCKTVDLSCMEPNTAVMMRRELDLLSSLDHPGIVRLYECADDPVDSAEQRLVLILEYISGGCCEALVKETRNFTEAQVAKLMLQLLAALSYCHAMGVAHRDVKPDNIMLEPSTFWGNQGYKLIDFGLSCRLDDKQTMRDHVGTAAYMAPEVVKRKPHWHPYTQKADLWSAGISALDLLIGETPFGRAVCSSELPEPSEEVYERIRAYKGFEDIEDYLDRNVLGQDLSADAKDFLQCMLHLDPDQRPTAEEALNHPWLEAHRPAPPGLSGEIARSLAGYGSASSTVRGCLLAVAARCGDPELEALGQVFLGLDRDGDGFLSREDMSRALDEEASSWWWGVGREELLDATQTGHGPGLTYTEFMAACLFGHREDHEELMAEAFTALDRERIGKVRLNDVDRFFREEDVPFLNMLPKDRAFTVEEWLRAAEEQGLAEAVEYVNVRPMRAMKRCHGMVCC